MVALEALEERLVSYGTGKGGKGMMGWGSRQLGKEQGSEWVGWVWVHRVAMPEVTYMAPAAKIIQTEILTRELICKRETRTIGSRL